MMYGTIETLVVVLGWCIIWFLMVEIHILTQYLWHLVYERGIPYVIWHLFVEHGWQVDNVIGKLIEELFDDPDICLVHFLAHMLGIYTSMMGSYYMVLMCMVGTWYGIGCTCLMFCSWFSIHYWHMFFLHEVWYGMSLVHGQVQGSS